MTNVNNNKLTAKEKDSTGGCPEKVKTSNRFKIKIFYASQLPKFVEIREKFHFYLNLDFSSNTMHRIEYLRNEIFQKVFKAR